MLPPVLVREEAMYGTGFFPTERSNIYALEEDGLFLAGTSEVALASLHMGEMLDELPVRYTGFSTCFRREAGAAGKDTRGMFRVHQFNKVEMFVFVEPETSWDEHDRMLDLEEQFLQALELPYRVMNVAGDLGASAAKKYDIEAWFPFQERYREVTSCSNTTDYQARRLGIRYRTEHGLEHPHTLNGTMVTDRALLAILENFQGGVPGRTPSTARCPRSAPSVGLLCAVAAVPERSIGAGSRKPLHGRCALWALVNPRDDDVAIDRWTAGSSLLPPSSSPASAAETSRLCSSGTACAIRHCAAGEAALSASPSRQVLLVASGGQCSVKHLEGTGLVGGDQAAQHQLLQGMMTLGEGLTSEVGQVRSPLTLTQLM